MGLRVWRGRGEGGLVSLGQCCDSVAMKRSFYEVRSWISSVVLDHGLPELLYLLQLNLLFSMARVYLQGGSLLKPLAISHLYSPLE